MDKKFIQSGLVDAAQELVGALKVESYELSNIIKSVKPKGVRITSVVPQGGREVTVEFDADVYPWIKMNFRVVYDIRRMELSLENTKGASAWTVEIAKAVGDNSGNGIEPWIRGTYTTPGSKKVTVSTKSKRLTTWPKLIGELIDDSGIVETAKIFEVNARKVAVKQKAYAIYTRTNMPSPWKRDGVRSYSPFVRPIAVKGVRLGQFSVEFEQSDTDIVITAKVDSTHEALKSAEKKAKFNTARYRSIEAGQKALIALSNRLVKELRGPVEAVAKKFAQQEMTKNKWLDAIDKRANTAYRGAKPYKDNNAKRRGYVVFEVKAGGRAIYYVAIGIKKITATNKGMTGVAYVRLGTYEDSLKKYLKIGDGEIFEDYFNESESFASKNVEFRVMADITKTFKGLVSEVKRAIMTAKTEGKEATPDMAAFLTRKERKVSGKRYDREREREKIHERKNIDVYHENGKRGLDWSAASHDQGYAERVVGGFSTMDEAKDYIIEDVGGGRDWVVVYGTQMDGKRLGRVDEDYDDE